MMENTGTEPNRSIDSARHCEQLFSLCSLQIIVARFWSYQVVNPSLKLLGSGWRNIPQSITGGRLLQLYY